MSDEGSLTNNDLCHLQQHHLVEDPESLPGDIGADRPRQHRHPTRRALIPDVGRRRLFYAHFLLAFCQLIMMALYWKESILAMTGNDIMLSLPVVGSNVQVLTQTADHTTTYPDMEHDNFDDNDDNDDDDDDDNDTWTDTIDGVKLGSKGGNHTSVITARPTRVNSPQYNETSREDKASSYQPFNTTNPHMHSWCPYAKCQNSPLCTPCNQRHLFILATGRSGSTTLLTMLNYLPNVRLSGENLNEMFVLSKLETNLYRPNSVKRLIDQPEDVPYGPLRHNGIPDQSMACPIQGVMRTLNPPPVKVQRNAGLNGHPFVEQYDQNMILGMKTIRYHRPHKMFLPKYDNWTIEESSNFLKNNFPCSKVLVNIRSDIEAQVSSRVKVKWGGTVESRELQKANVFLQTLASELGEDMAKVIDMTEWVDNISVLNSVVEWLGFKDCNFTSIAHENHDGYHRDKKFRNPFVGSNCRYPY